MSKNHRKENFKIVSFEINKKKEMCVVVMSGTRSSFHIVDPLMCADISKDGSTKEECFRFNAEVIGGGPVKSLPRNVAHLSDIVFKTMKGTPVRGSLRNSPAGWKLKKD